MSKEIFVLIICCTLSYCEDNFKLNSRYFNLYNHKLLQNFNQIEPTKQGPVLFPNDAPPPHRPPLIVTSRPLSEQISKSELNPEPVNNTIADQSQIQYLARQNVYTPYNIPTTPSPTILVNSVTGQPILGGNFQKAFNNFDYKQAYDDLLKKNYNDFGREQQYNDYEDRSVLPPIYKAFADHANQNVIKLQQKKLKVKQPVDYENNYYTNELQNDNGSKDYVQGKNYAFSYSVRDHKTGDDFSHRQHSSGDATNGEYRVRLPDGRMQIVSYVADENGYKADVRYDVDNDKIKDNTIKEPKPQQQPKKPITDDYYNQYSDLSKEYYNNDYIDYTSKNYNDYKYTNRKFAKYEPKINNNKIGVIVVPNQFKSSTVKPSYEELKPLFVTRKPYQVSSSQNYLYNTIPIELNVPSTTANPFIYSEPTTERVVVIGTKSPLYTNIRHSLPSFPVTSTPSSLYNSVSPSFAVSSTNGPILSKNVNFSNNKAILSSSFIDRINKYLSFT